MNPAAFNGIFMIVRTPGLISHVIEEQTRGGRNHRYDAPAPWAIRESVILNISLDEKD
jgi:hypothetical protein